MGLWNWMIERMLDWRVMGLYDCGILGYGG